jgi:hypothetical protein
MQQQGISIADAAAAAADLTTTYNSKLLEGSGSGSIGWRKLLPLIREVAPRRGSVGSSA